MSAVLFYCRVCCKYTPDHEFCFIQPYNKKNPHQKEFDNLLKIYKG